MAAQGEWPNSIGNCDSCGMTTSWTIECAVQSRRPGRGAPRIKASSPSVASFSDLRAGWPSFFKVLPKTQPITVAIFHVEVATAIRLVANIPRDNHALGFELRVECIRVINPDVGVPGSPFGIDGSVRAHYASHFELL